MQKAPLNITPAATKIINVDIWVVGVLDQIYSL